MSGFLSFRDASIRTKVILAFLGVLLLILPQIVLTVSYMVELFEDGDSVGRSSGASLTLGKIHMTLEHGFLEPYPVTQEAFDEHKKTVVSVSDNIEDAENSFLALQIEDERFKSYAATLAHMRRELDGYLAELELQVETNLQVVPPVSRREVTSRIHQDLDDLTRAWDDPLLDSQEEEPETADERLSVLRKIAFRAIKDVVAAQNSDDAVSAQSRALRRRQADETWQKRRMILGTIGGLRAQVNNENALAAEEIKRSVDEANRYLITLVLLTLVYIFVVILVLPSRLVRPLVHFSSVVERAATGQLDVRARVVGDDEMGDMGRRLNTMLERLGTFDRLKRDRIYEDSARIRTLGDRLQGAVAILDTNFTFEYANAAMRKLLTLPDDVEGRELLSVLGGRDAQDLVALLDKTLKRRRRLERVTIELESKRGLQRLLVDTEIGRNRAGKISYLIMTLSEQS